MRWRLIPHLVLAVTFLGCRRNDPSPPPPKEPAKTEISQRPQAPRLEPQASQPETPAPVDTPPPSPPQSTPKGPVPPESDILARLAPSDATVSWADGVKVSGEHGVITSVEPAATRVGIQILERGGNAIDAAVATAFALAVTHPSAANLGGGGFLLLRHGDAVEAIDFREDSPAGLQVEQFWKMIGAGGRGPHSVGVPGTVAGLYLAHQRHGVLPWADLLRPAEDLARAGYTLGKRQAQTIMWAREPLRRSQVAREVFFNGNAPKPAHSRVVRPRLALALSRIREQGAKGFYEGPTARDLVASVGGALSERDLSAYRARVRVPLFFDFGAHRVVTMPPPSGGGVALTQQLLMLQELAIEGLPKDTPERLHLIAEAGRRAQLERQLFVVAPEVLSGPEQHQSRARVLDPRTWLDPHPIDPTKVSLSSDLHGAYRKLTGESEQTTHLSVIDAHGNLVSLTLTLSGSYGSYIFSKETGIVLNNSVASFSPLGRNTPAGGQRTVSSMAPTFVFTGPHALVLGSPGGDTIPSTIVQLFLRLCLDGDSLGSALPKPRIHQGFIPQELSMERFAPLSPATRAGLRQLGHEVVFGRSTQGDANIAAFVGGRSYAVCDSREGGLALAASRSSLPPVVEEVLPTLER